MAISDMERTALINKFHEFKNGIWLLIRNWRFYVGLAVLLAGIRLNFLSQVYLHKYVTQGNTMPSLSDMILDNIPLLDIGYMYDIASFTSAVIFGLYIIHRRKYREVPLYLMLCGTFHLVRGVFIVLTPLGHPEMFDGTEGLFNGFSKYELGVYPSGHTGISWLYFLLATDKRYRIALLICVFVIIAALFFSRGHYSIDILSGIFFSYAIKSYGVKHWQFMKIRQEDA